VQVWTVDETGEMERLLDMGVHGVMTDRPSVLRAVMRARRVWRDG
jgi:glycerophosphoryl diester phosphodiesterase